MNNFRNRWICEVLIAYVDPTGAALSFVAILLLGYAWVNVKSGLDNGTLPKRILTQLAVLLMAAIFILLWLGASSLGIFV